MNEPACDVVFVVEVLAFTPRQVDDTLNIILVEHLAKLSFVPEREKDLLDAYIRQTVQEVFYFSGRAVEFKVHIDQQPRDGLHFWLRDVASNEDARVLRRKFEAGGALQSGPVRLVDIFSETGHLSGAGHF